MPKSRWTTVVTWFVASRLVIFAIGVIGVSTFANVRTGAVLEGTAALSPEQVWHKWDALWYERVALHGYGYELETARGQAAAGFFPLFPYTVRALMTLAGGLSFFWTASLLSNLLALAALLLLAGSLIDRDDAVQRVVAIVTASAGSFYLSIPYSESLFLLLVVITLIATKKGQYEVAGLVAGLSATTRIHGLALIAVPAVACVLDRKIASPKRWVRAAATLALFSIPFIIYLVHLDRVTGTWTAFFARQELWDNPSPVPFQALTGFLHFPRRISNWLHGGFWLLYLWLLIRYWRRMPLGSALFCAGVFLITTQQEAFHGTYRYMVPLVPLAMALADDTPAVRQRVMAINLAFGVLMILAFVTWNRIAV